MLELMPIFERVRQREELPCAYPLQVGSGGSLHPATITHSPSYHWVIIFLDCAEYLRKQHKHKECSLSIYCSLSKFFYIFKYNLLDSNKSRKIVF